MKPECRQSGFAAPVTLLGIALVLVGIIGVSVDLWRVLGEHTRLAALADGAAVAAASGIDLEALYESESPDIPIDQASAVSLACGYLKEEADVAGCPGPGADVMVDGSRIAVTLRRSVPLGPMRLLFLLSGGIREVTVEASAAASPFRRLPVAE